MAIQPLNCYARCRKRHGVSQEEWAEKLGISVDSVKRYESGDRIPSNGVVLKMAQLTGWDGICAYHLQNTSGDLDVFPAMDADISLPLAVIRLVNKVLAFADQNRGEQLLQIAEDGKITDDEMPLFNECMDAINEIISAGYQVRYADDGREVS